MIRQDAAELRRLNDTQTGRHDPAFRGCRRTAPQRAPPALREAVNGQLDVGPLTRLFFGRRPKVLCATPNDAHDPPRGRADERTRTAGRDAGRGTKPPRSAPGSTTGPRNRSRYRPRIFRANREAPIRAFRSRKPRTANCEPADGNRAGPNFAFRPRSFKQSRYFKRKRIVFAYTQCFLPEAARSPADVPFSCGHIITPPAG